MNHLSPEQISDYIMSGEFPIDEQELRRTREHFETCSDCRALYDQMKTRFDKIRLPDPDTHIRMLNEKAKRMEKRAHTLRMAFRAAAAVLVMLTGYGTTSWLVNRQFDQSPIGLADLRPDYEYAKIPTTYRGETKGERDDILLFKDGVMALFSAKTNAFGLFPSYDLNRVERADEYFSQSESITKDDGLKRRIEIFRERIRLMKKEIKR